MAPKFFNKLGIEKQTNIEQINFETQIVPNSKNPLFVNAQYPMGRIFDLGVFYSNKEGVNINFQVFSKGRNTTEQVLGEAELLSTDLIDINEPSKENCLILYTST